MEVTIGKEQIEELEKNGILVNEDEATVISNARWGTSELTLTPDILRQLKSGKIWAYSDGEYVTLIRFAKKGFLRRIFG